LMFIDEKKQIPALVIWGSDEDHIPFCGNSCQPGASRG
jgi:hypothetical protein